jgi:hypothetical protein
MRKRAPSGSADQFTGRFTLVQGFGEERGEAISGLEIRLFF